MLNYLIRRLLLLPLTLFCIILVNFVIINLAPGDPVTVTEISAEGTATRSADRAMAFGSDERYLQFRERYGLTLPILFNSWPWISKRQVDDDLGILLTHRETPDSPQEMPVKTYDALRVTFGDESRYIMPKLLEIIQDSSQPLPLRSMASRFFVRGGTQQAFLGTGLTDAQMSFNRKIAIDNNLLRSLVISAEDSSQTAENKIRQLTDWYQANRETIVRTRPQRKRSRSFFSRLGFGAIWAGC